MMDWTPKLWGRMRTVLRDDRLEISEAEIEAGGYSSIHRHNCKTNTFIVVSGRLMVKEFSQGVVLSERVLTPVDDPFQVPAGIKHQFEALEPTRIIEIYRAVAGYCVLADDIARFSEGGLRKA
jgi:quercetin dioxygenase-like cupin family protein